MSLSKQETGGLRVTVLSLWPLLFPLLLLLPGLAQFPYPSPETEFSDFSITHYPNALFLKRALVDWGQVPLWSPGILSGYPFAANPLSGLWYPPGWLVLLFPLPLGLNLLAALHLLWGGAGMYVFLRSSKLSHIPALFGALAFATLPKLYAHYGAGHLTFIYAISWSPWLLASVRAHLAGGRQFSFFRPGLILGLIFLADPRWAVYAGLLLTAYLFAYSHSSLVDKTLLLLRQILLAVLIAAPLAFPFLEYTRLSTRVRLAPEDFLLYSLSPTRLLGLLFPGFGGFHEFTLYSGIAVLVLAVLALAWRSTRRRARFWMWLALLALLFSFGEYLPGMRLLAGLPGFSLLRVPSRAIFLVGLALAVLSAYALERLVGAVNDLEARSARLIIFAFAAGSLGLSAGVWLVTRDYSLTLLWGASFAALFALWLAAFLAGRLSTRHFYLGLFLLLLVDLGAVNRSLFAPRAVDSALGEGAEAARFLASQPDLGRVYSPSYSLPQQTAAFYGLELTDGVDPLQLASYVQYMSRASGVPVDGYDVTLPPYDRLNLNARYEPRADLLGALNVVYVAAAYDLESENLEFLAQFADTRVYKNELALPRAWTQPVQDPTGESIAPAEIIAWQPNRIVLRARGPGLLVLSEIAYPGWRVTVDGQAASLQTHSGILRAVELGAGEHEVVFTFLPLSLYLGLTLSLFTILTLLISPRLPGLRPR